MFFNRNGEPRVGLIAIAAVLFVSLVSVGVWGFRVATSDIKGKGDAIINKNNGVNRVIKQEMFEQMYAGIKADDDKIQTSLDAYRRNKSYTNEVNLNGVIQHCQQAVQDYNAEARKYSSEDFRAVDLPAQISDFDAATDCVADSEN